MRPGFAIFKGNKLVKKYWSEGDARSNAGEGEHVRELRLRFTIRSEKPWCHRWLKI